MKEIFNFDSLRSLIKGDGGSPFSFLIDGMSGVTGPYIRRIFVDELGAPEEFIVRALPLEDFGGHHPDPNLTYAADLVKSLEEGRYSFVSGF